MIPKKWSLQSGTGNSRTQQFTVFPNISMDCGYASCSPFRLNSSFNSKQTRLFHWGIFAKQKKEVDYGHISSNRKLTVRYSFEGDSAHPRVFKVKIKQDLASVTVSQLYDWLVEDRVNLRAVSGIRYWKPKDNGFVKVSADEILLSKAMMETDLIELELEKSRSKALFIGPVISVDPNFGVLWNRLNPIIRLPFLACGQLFKRKYQADIISVGLKFDLSIRCQVAFMYRAPFKQIYYHEPIQLGRGMELIWGMHITWCSFANTSGGILLVGIPIGLAAGVSYITGGTLVPVETSNPKENFPVPTEEILKRQDVLVEPEELTNSPSKF